MINSLQLWAPARQSGRLGQPPTRLKPARCTAGRSGRRQRRRRGWRRRCRPSWHRPSGGCTSGTSACASFALSPDGCIPPALSRFVANLDLRRGCIVLGNPQPGAIGVKSWRAGSKQRHKSSGACAAAPLAMHVNAPRQRMDAALSCCSALQLLSRASRARQEAVGARSGEGARSNAAVRADRALTRRIGHPFSIAAGWAPWT